MVHMLLINLRQMRGPTNEARTPKNFFLLIIMIENINKQNMYPKNNQLQNLNCPKETAVTVTSLLQSLVSITIVKGSHQAKVQKG